MYIVSTKDGELVQFSNMQVDDISVVLDTLTSVWGNDLIYTTDKVVCEKAEHLEWFSLAIDNGRIIDIIESEPLATIPKGPTLEERIAALEAAMSFMLGM